MRKIFYLLAVALLVACVDKGSDEQQSQPANVIYYISEGGEIIKPNKAAKFGASILSNTYENGLGTITFNNPVRKIGAAAFYNIRELMRVSIPHEVVLIDEYAFAACTNLVEAVIGSGVKEIGRNAFAECHHLIKINIPNSVTSIGEYAFKNSSLSDEINLPNNLTSIERGVFSGTGITRVTIPNSVTSIGDGAFEWCSNLIDITIPDSVTELGIGAFAGCKGPFYGKFASEDNYCLVVDGVLNSFAYGGVASYTIPSSVTKIGAHSFYRSDSLKSVTIPQTIISIGQYAFSYCELLETVYFEGVTPPLIGELGWVFFESKSLKNIYVPSGSIDAYKSVFSEYAELIVGY